uniref:Uncharacterized protein n=1 Tax=Anguilla anguilla TaxID=7936 RepID=A0A0E9SJ63_ANGAN
MYIFVSLWQNVTQQPLETINNNIQFILKCTIIRNKETQLPSVNQLIAIYVRRY